MAGPNAMEKYFQDLDEQAKIDFKNKSVKVILTRVNQMYNMAEKSIRATDFAQAYLFYSKWFQCFEWLKRQKGLDKKTFKELYPDFKVREGNNMVNFIKETLKKQHQHQISNSNDFVKNKKSDINKDNINLELPEVPKDEPQPKDKTDISCKELFDIFNKSDENTRTRILIIDVRSSKDFATAKMSFEDNVIHIPADEINDSSMPCAYRFTISKFNSCEAVTRYNRRSSKYTDLIVLVDSNSAVSTMDPNSPIGKLKKCLVLNDQVTDINRIAILNGGFEKWKKLYPKCIIKSVNPATNSSVTNNSPSGSEFSDTSSQPTNKNFNASPVISNSPQEPINADYHSPILTSKHRPGKQINSNPRLPLVNTTNSTEIIPTDFNFPNSTLMDYQVPPTSDSLMRISDINPSVPFNQYSSGTLNKNLTNPPIENSPNNSINSSTNNLASLYQELPAEFNKSLRVPMVPSESITNGTYLNGINDKQLLHVNNITLEPKVVLNKILAGRPDIDRSKKPGRSKSNAEAIVELERNLMQLNITIKDYEVKQKNNLLDNWGYEKLETMRKKAEEMMAELTQKKSAETFLYPILQNFSLGTKSREARSPHPNNYSENKENIQEPRTPKKIETPPPKPEFVTPPAQKIPAQPHTPVPLAQRMEIVDDDEEEKIYKQPLKSTPTATNTGLKRSHSSPNLTQVKKFKENDGQDKLKEDRRIVPDIDRSTKPKEVVENTSKQAYHSIQAKHWLNNREQRLEAVYASSGLHPGITGLKNLGNSCYMNSIIQCLSNTECLAKYFTENQYVSHLNKNDKIVTNVAEEVAQVIKALWRGQYKSISPRDLKIIVGQSKMQFGSYDQQDSHEFLMFLLDWMHNDLKQEAKVVYHRDLTTAETEWEKSMNGQSSVISKLFFGQLRSTIECLSCQKTSETYETFNSLTMSLPDFNKCKLDDCVKKFVSGQNVSGWKCPNCKKPREGIKKFDIAKLPHIIVIHLNRFGDTRGWLEKKSTAVEFPLNNFNLKPYIVQDGDNTNNANTYYNLYAMSNHYGTMDGGHYTAYCRSYAQNKWYKYDDHTVTEVTSHQVQNQSSSAYLLFYASAQAEAFLNR